MLVAPGVKLFCVAVLSGLALVRVSFAGVDWVQTNGRSRTASPHYLQGSSIVILNEVKNLGIVQQRPFVALRVTYAGLA